TVTTAPDLLITSATLTPVEITSGQSVTASFIIVNQGDANAGTSNLKYYLSSDNQYNTGDTYLATEPVGALAVNANLSYSSLITIPAGTATGSYYLLFRADADNQVAESNENNNLAAVAISVTSTDPGCNSSVQYPSNIITPGTNWKSQKNIYGGEYTAFNVTIGSTYVFSYCSADGAVAPFDTELTLRNKATDAFLAYDNNNCGDDAKITWTATFTGQVKLVTTVSGCVTNTTSATLRYRRLAKVADGMEDGGIAYQVYPNPVTSLITVESAAGFEGISEITLLNAAGREVRRIIVPEKADNIMTLAVEDLPAGYYMLRLSGSGKVLQFKTVIMH
ncbi:MAG TPA: CARDB domain-containing protein, partial [Lentimicrobium sp.]|nr:CARDB domain-containing protein [Lentimicrobium sp.]